MAESILTSINLAGGSFNVYYDTVLAVFSITGRGNANNNCPNGWRAALVVSHRRYLNLNGFHFGILVEPITVFNTNATCMYYSTYRDEDNAVLTVANVINISATSFTLQYYSTSYDSCTGTVIFVA